MSDDLLYISPVIPDVSGNGLAMRAAAVLEALSAHYHVSLLVIPHYAPYDAPIPDVIGRLCQAMAVLPSPRFGSPETTVSLWTVMRQLFGRRRSVPGNDLPFDHAIFSVIHAFRLATLPYARPYRDRSRDAHLRLDLDDIESATHRRLADLYRVNGAQEPARREEWLAERASVAEDEAFTQVDRVYVCSEIDAAALRPRTDSDILVLPNVVRPVAAIEPPPTNHPFNFLFVGNLGYYSNEDAAQFLCHEILSALRLCARCDFTVTIVGGGSEEILAPLRLIPEVRVAGAVPDVASYYRDSHAVVVPLRSGGGTRIKVLEAFSFRRPVVTTSIGIEGIAAQDRRDVLVADEPRELAQRCASLMTDGGHRNGCRRQ